MVFPVTADDIDFNSEADFRLYFEIARKTWWGSIEKEMGPLEDRFEDKAERYKSADGSDILHSSDIIDSIVRRKQVNLQVTLAKRGHGAAAFISETKSNVHCVAGKSNYLQIGQGNWTRYYDAAIDNEKRATTGSGNPVADNPVLKMQMQTACFQNCLSLYQSCAIGSIASPSSDSFYNTSSCNGAHASCRASCTR
jgi:hypothetical protein